MLTACLLAAQLEATEKPAPLQDQVSLIATSSFGDFLVLTETFLKYAHVEISFDELRSVSIDRSILEQTITKLEFNESADTVLLVGPYALGAVLPPPRRQDGVLSLSCEWITSVFLCEDDATIVDAIFPRQFDDHVCMLDAAGVFRFLHVTSGRLTKVITTLYDARDFCFGLSDWGRFGVFVATSDLLSVLSPIAPRKCCAPRHELHKLHKAEINNLQNGTENAVLNQASKTKQWLSSTFPDASSNSGGVSKSEVESYEWSTANEERHLSDAPLSGCSLSLRQEIGRPLKICVIDNGPLVVLAIATEDCCIHVLMTNNNIFTPIWRSADSPFEFLMQHVESLLLLRGKYATISQLHFIENELYCFHGHGVAVLDLHWMKSVRRAGKDSSLAKMIIMRPTHCRHVILSTDNNVMGSAMVKQKNHRFGIVICWFDDGSCCVVNLTASQFAQHNMYAFVPWRPNPDMSRLITATSLILNNMFGKLKFVPMHTAKTKIASSSYGAIFKLRAMCEALETNVIAEHHSFAELYAAMAQVLHSIHATHQHQFNQSYKRVNVLADSLAAIKTTACQTIVEQKARRDRVAILAAITAEIRPRLSHSEIVYFNDLASLATQIMRVDYRTHIEMKHFDINHFFDVGEIPAKLSQSHIMLFRNLLTSQTNFLSQASNNILAEDNKNHQY